MKKCVFFMVPVALAIILTTGCSQQGKNNAPKTDESTLQDMVNIDEITDIESIIADSTLENATGDPSWKKINSGMIRVKKNGKFYLRMETNNGTMTAVTYQYDK